MSFDKDFIYGLDLNKAAVDQQGAGSTALLSGSNHIWSWKIKKSDGSLVGMNMQAAAEKQYGTGAKAVCVGAYGADWRAIKPSELKYKVIPILFVCGSKIYDAAAVKSTLDVFESHIMGSQEWLRQELDKTFDAIQPLVVYCNIPESQFTAWNLEMATPGPNQYKYFNSLMAEVTNFMGTGYNPSIHRYISLFWPYQQDGSIAGMTGGVAVCATGVSRSPFKIYDVANLQGTTPEEPDDNAYVILHEFCHTLGLPHKDNDSTKLMWTARPPHAEFAADEKAILLASPFLR